MLTNSLFQMMSLALFISIVSSAVIHPRITEGSSSSVTWESQKDSTSSKERVRRQYPYGLGYGNYGAYNGMYNNGMYGAYGGYSPVSFLF
ncbi:hypothetical protein CAEBREN_25870 [Caenorhabditis brenneri]|uniref:Uncharacterized protein n=1 Tax=Caenorhabditis brenneri TaxID=135651 RepID=G0PHA9_CAEBE|nr:hypothetical protein CAEBREN_25870 [Caenorhabditis brenneri]